MKTSRTPNNWTNILFFSLTPLLAIAGIYWLYASGRGVPAATWVLTAIGLYATGLGITSGYHRLFAHKTYDAPWPIRLFFLVITSGSFEGSALEWSSDHRTHHRFVDTDKDPYNIKAGFWFAHIGWLFKRPSPPLLYDNVTDLLRDPLIRFQHRYYIPLAILVSFGIPTLIASLWGDPWGGFFVAGVTRMVFNHHATFCINSVCHYLGTQPYSDRHTGRDSWITAIFTYGEGYHNYHHEFPGDYRNGIRAWHWDPGKWLIYGLKKVGLARNLKKVQPDRIFQARLEMDEKKLVQKLATHPGLAKIDWHHLVSKNRQRLIDAHAHFLKLKQDYKRLKSEKMDYVADQMEKVHAEIQKARENFERSLTEWRMLLRNPVVA
ncbi:MAG: fatty acid desaturase [Deltaproteobacteria bacterium]|nr:fatty acid desaturase [Deltaproteobacteria bacterium]